MAGISSDYIQQQLLDQSIAANDNLSAMRQILLDIEKKPSGGSTGNNGTPPPGNRNRNNNNRNNNSSFKKAFKDLFGEAGNLGKATLGNNASTESLVSSVGTSAKALSSSLGMLPGPIGLAASGMLKIVEVGAQIYDYMNEQLKMYNQLNSAGVQLADGMLTLRKGSGAAFMSINEFGQAVTRNSDAVAAMTGQYGDGVEHFGKLMNSVQLAQDTMGIYGVSAQQLADITAKNYKFEKMYAGQSTLRNMSETQSTQQFVGTMTYLSKTVGKSVDELISKFGDMGQNLDSNILQSSLEMYAGLSQQKSAEVTKSMTSIYSSMGEAGKTLQTLNAKWLSDSALPEEYSGSNFIAGYMQQLQGLQQSGITDVETIRKAMSQYTKTHEEQLKTEQFYLNKAGQTQAANLLTQLNNAEALFNDQTKKTNPIIESFTNKFNNWLGKTFTQPFNDAYTRMAESSAKYLTDLANNSDNAWDFTAKLFRDGIKAIPTTFNEGMAYLQTSLENLGTDIFGDGYAKVSASFEKFMDDFTNLPQNLWNSIKGWFGADTKKNEEQAKKVQEESTKSLMDNYNELNSSLNSSIKKLISWWNEDEPKKPEIKDKPVDTKTEPETPETKPTPKPVPTAVQLSQSGQQQVTAQAEYTKPVKIEQADQTDSKPQAQEKVSTDNDAITKLLSGILNNLESQGQNNAQLTQLLRQIADNTEEPRNI